MISTNLLQMDQCQPIDGRILFDTAIRQISRDLSSALMFRYVSKCKAKCPRFIKKTERQTNKELA